MCMSIQRLLLIKTCTVLRRCDENDRERTPAVIRVTPDIVTAAFIGADPERLSLFTFYHRDTASISRAAGIHTHQNIIPVEMSVNLAAILIGSGRH